MLDWNDLRHFVAVARAGSTLAAARTGRLSQTTVARRIAALEAALGVALFERLSSGYALTPAGEALLPHAEAVARAADGLTRAAGSIGRDLAGTVRVTMEEIFAVTIVPPLLAALRTTHPELRIAIDVAFETRDLAAGEAEVALRSCIRPEGGGLVAQRLTDAAWTFYASRAYAARHGLPDGPEALARHALIGGGGAAIGPIYDRWIARHGLEAAVTLEQGSVPGLLAAVRAGAGVASLPCLAADSDPDLVRCFPPPPAARRGLWIVTHERWRHSPRVRVAIDHLAAGIRALARRGP